MTLSVSLGETIAEREQQACELSDQVFFIVVYYTVRDSEEACRQNKVKTIVAVQNNTMAAYFLFMVSILSFEIPPPSLCFSCNLTLKTFNLL